MQNLGPLCTFKTVIKEFLKVFPDNFSTYHVKTKDQVKNE